LHTVPPPSNALDAGFESYPSEKGNFGHLLLLHRTPDDGTLSQALRPYFESAHLDARRKFHADIGIDLHPDAAPGDALTISYPGCLPSTTQKGLFGEVMAGLVTEKYKLVGGHQWRVPIFLFRYHEDARNYLFSLARDPMQQRQALGRLGSDFIGLLLDQNGYVVRFIAGEAKWRKRLIPSVIDGIMLGDLIDDPAGGPKKVRSGKGVWNDLNTDPAVPFGIRQLQWLLEEGDPDGFAAAILSLDRALLLANPQPLPRTDLVLIVGTGSPKRDKMECLLPFDGPPAEYTAKRDLQLVEIVLKEGEELVETLYESLWSDGQEDAGV
jgi:hypothetical protein